MFSIWLWMVFYQSWYCLLRKGEEGFRRLLLNEQKPLSYLSTVPKKYLKILEYSVKRTSIFHLILVGILSIFILPVKNRGWFFFLLNGQNPLRVTKVICQQSLTSWCGRDHYVRKYKFRFSFNQKKVNNQFHYSCI